MRIKKGKDRQEVYKKTVELLRKFGAKKVAIFGSYVRNEETSESDIDILVEFSENRKNLVRRTWNKSRFTN